MRGEDANPSDLFVDEILRVTKKTKHVKSALSAVEVWKDHAADLFDLKKNDKLKAYLGKYLDELDKLPGSDEENVCISI